MKKFLNNLHKEAEHIRLSHAEKAAMRLALQKAMAEGAAIFGAPSGVHVEKSPYVFVSFFSSHQFRMVMAGFLMFVVVGSGTASAAQGALPGDFLYPIKLSITEKVEAALAPNAAAKATVEMKFAERRVEEAQTLASEGRLDASVAAQLADNFDQHAGSVETLVEEVEATDPGAAVQIKTRLASSLSVNGAVLQRIGRGSSDEDTKEQSDTLGTRVIARAEGPAKIAMQARAFAAPAASDTATDDKKAKSTESMQMTMSLAANEDPTERQEVAGSDRAAAQLQEKASESLTSAKKLYEEVKVQLDATSTAAVSEAFSSAGMHMSAGATALGSKRYGEAQQEFTEALRISARLYALLVAEKKFDNGLLKDLLDGGGEDRRGQE